MYRLDRPLQVVLHSHELDVADLLVGADEDVPGPPVAVLGFARGAGVEEVDPLDEPVPGLVGVAEGDQVPNLGARGLSHLGAEGVGTVIGPVEGVESGCPMHKGDLRAGLVPAAGSQVHPEGQRPEKLLGLRCDVGEGLLVAQVREFLLAGGLGLAAAVLVVCRHRRVVVTRDAGYPASSERSHHLVGPGSGLGRW